MMPINQDDKQSTSNHDDNNSKNDNHHDNNEQQKDELDTAANGFDVFAFTEGVNNIILFAFCIGIGIIVGIITFAIASNPMAAWHNIILFTHNHNNSLRIITGLLALFSTIIMIAFIPPTIIMIANIPHDMISLLDNKNKLELGNRPGRIIHIILPLLIIMSMTALLAWFATNIVWVVLPYAIVWLGLSILLLVPSSHEDKDKKAK